MPLLCVGATDGAKCKFGPNKKRAQVAKGALRCTWCDPEKLEEVMLLSNTRKGTLIKFKNFDPDLQQIIIGRVPAWCKKAFVESGGDPIYLTAKELDELCLRHGQPFVSAKMEHSETTRASAQCPVCPRGEQSQWATCKERGTSLGKRCRTYPSTPSDQRLLEGFRPDAAEVSDARHRVSRKSTAQAARQTQGA